MTSGKQQQGVQKQILLNDYVDKLMELSNVTKYQKSKYDHTSNYNNIKKISINFMQMFDLLIWIQKKKPQLLFSILQMDLLSLIINLIPLQQISTQIRAFILLINNCKINGEIIINLLANKLIDLVIYKYLKSLSTANNASKVSKLFGTSNKNNQDLQQKLQYLGSLLKACNIHLNQKTYPYFINTKFHIDNFNTHQSNLNAQKPFQVIGSTTKNNNKSTIPSCDLDDIFNTCDISLHNHYMETQQKECLLIKVCTRFYNCPEEITKTAVMNIIMNILREPFAKQLIFYNQTNKPYPYINEWTRNLCCQFRNQLKNLNQQLMVLKPNEQEFFIQELNDKIMIWEDLTQNKQFNAIFKDNFIHNVIYSLVIGALNTSSLPMFNIKFTFFILAKMMKICSNLDILNQMGELLFVKKQLHYSQNWVSTAVLSGFDLNRILDDEYWNTQNRDNQDLNKFDGVNQFFFNMVKSKDQHFLQISSNILQQLVLHVKKDQKSIQYFREKLGFGINGGILLNISSILIGQLRFDHTLNNLKKICQTIIYIHPSKHISQDTINQFLYFYSEYLNEAMCLIEKGSKHLEYVIQTFQYDMKILEHMKFIPKSLKDRQLLIHPSQREQKGQQREQKVQKKQKLQKKQKSEKLKQQKHFQVFRKSFYNMIPQTPSQILRYKIIKTFLFLKFKSLIIESQIKQDILTKYVSRLKIWQQKQPKPGDKLAYPIKQKFHNCKIIEDKVQIPCMIIEDDINLIIGFIEQKHVKIIVNVKIKHLQAQVITKKDKTYIKIVVNKFDFQSQNIVHKNTFTIRGFEAGIQYLAVKKQNFKQKELNSIKKGLRKTVQNLPEISLL